VWKAWLVEFFEPPPRPPRPHKPPRRTPEWFAPPDNVAPGVAALELMLVNTGEFAMYVSTVLAYPNGFELTLLMRARQEFADEREEFWPMGMSMRRWHAYRGGAATDAIPPELLRFGLQFSDGSKVTNVGSSPFPTAFDEEIGDKPPRGPTMMQQGGGGGGASYEQTYWVQPLPPAGELVFACEWPQRQIPLTTATIDADVILEAAARAVELWPAAEPSEEWGGFSGGGDIIST
jgi:hypothetical protein